MSRGQHNIQALIDRLIQREGGFSDNPADKGGPTNYGITLATLVSWRGHPCSKREVRAMDRAEAREIYCHRYWIEPGFHLLDISPVVQEMLFDTAVHSGPGQAVKLLQQAVGVEPDGIIGPVTREAVCRFESTTLAALFMGERIHFLGRLITRDPDQSPFAGGWMGRMREFVVQIPLA
jgi:lysozyme family protein